MPDTPPKQLINPLLSPEQLPPAVFGDERVRIDHGEENVIYVDGTAKELRPMVFEVVSILAANRGYYVPYDYIFKAVWPDFEPETYTHFAQNPNSKISNALGHVNKVLGVEDLGHSETGVLRTLRGVGIIALIDRNDLRLIPTIG